MREGQASERQSVKRRDRQMRNRLNASDLARRSKCPGFACKAKQNQRRRQEILGESINGWEIDGPHEGHGDHGVNP